MKISSRFRLERYSDIDTCTFHKLFLLRWMNLYSKGTKLNFSLLIFSIWAPIHYNLLNIKGILLIHLFLNDIFYRKLSFLYHIYKILLFITLILHVRLYYSLINKSLLIIKHSVNFLFKWFRVFIWLKYIRKVFIQQISFIIFHFFEIILLILIYIFF